MDDLNIRELKENEYKILDNFLYEAIFIPKGTKKPPREIINKEELQVYVKDFGSYKDDNCIVAELNNKIVGACWNRIMNDYGHIDSLYEEYRGKGIGTKLMETMLKLLKDNNKENYKLSYKEIKNIIGFEIDHSFLTYKKEAKEFGYKVGKISMKEKIIIFNKIYNYCKEE